ncbi:uncharacterized protein LOC107646803 [Arachis ipaensis]|uniref:uncharacterized protein LOC107646803 n=1 Tax=Arachis ipaensis TaxID=130454 RepID=UPI0007AFA237|nr:uncharacterized protein LOC107646803 [Arachis ipaensis]
MSDLEINFEKSTIIPINYDEQMTHSLKVAMRCSVGSLFISYLGIPLGANPKRISTWKSLINKIEKKLSSWKDVKGGGEEDNFNAILVLLGKQQDKRVMPTTKWSTIQKPKKHGRLGVGDMAMKNAAMLFKWW